MAYFSNGTEGEPLDNECADCVFGQEPCPVYLVQSIYNYKACNNEIARAILNDLVKQDDKRNYIGCQLKPLLDKYYEQNAQTNQ